MRILLIFYNFKNWNLSRTDEIYLSLDIRYCGVQLYCSFSQYFFSAFLLILYILYAFLKQYIPSCISSYRKDKRYKTNYLINSISSLMNAHQWDADLQFVFVLNFDSFYPSYYVFDIDQVMDQIMVKVKNIDKIQVQIVFKILLLYYSFKVEHF